MRITGVGIDASEDHVNGSLAQLEEDLVFFRSCGFDTVEISVHGLDIIINGRLQHHHMEKVCAITRGFDFLYTVHAPERLNLAFPQSWPGHPPDLTLEKDTFLACLGFCAAIGASVLVYHSGLIALHQVAFGIAPLPNDELLEQAREREVTALRELLPLAAERGVIVVMENRDPHLWEVAALMKAGLPPTALSKYHAGMRIPKLIEQIEAVNHPHLGLALDFAHLFLAANYCGFDYLNAIQEAAPYVCHLHGSDNFGRLGGVFDKMSERIPYGDGDVHLPPGWGNIPHIESLTQLPDYDGLYILEIRSRFFDHFPEALETIRHMINHVNGDNCL